MRNVVLACVAAVSLAGCGMHRDRNTESSGSTTPPTAQAQTQPSYSGTAARPDWNECDQHPYMPGPSRKCE